MSMTVSLRQIRHAQTPASRLVQTTSCPSVRVGGFYWKQEDYMLDVYSRGSSKRSKPLPSPTPSGAHQLSAKSLQHLERKSAFTQTRSNCASLTCALFGFLSVSLSSLQRKQTGLRKCVQLAVECDGSNRRTCSHPA